MADLTFLDSRHPIYASHEAGWKREEKRLAGGDAVLDELITFAHEATTTYVDRQRWARWVGFGRVHTTILSGHLTSKIPVPNYAQLGEVRERGEIAGDPSLAELFHYNCDGIGTDGLQLPTFMDGVQQRALATGFRWLLMEMPTRQSLSQIRLRLLGDDGEGLPTEQEVRNGFRPYLIEYSPLSVTNWRVKDGVLRWAVIRCPVDPALDFGTDSLAGGLGYYLLVRSGYQGLGEEFRAGGWWKYDAAKRLLDGDAGRGTWADTDGQIPLWMHVGEPGNGTYERPSIGQSSTMELGQISADLMNAISEQRFNARQAAKSNIYILGIDSEAHAKVITQVDLGQLVVGVPVAKDGLGGVVVPTIYNTSEGAMATEVYATINQQAVDSAKEIMVRQIVAAPDASGARVEAEHESATSPMLARIAGTAETSWNTLLYFCGRRFGLPHEQALAMNVAIPRDFKLRDVQTDIDAMLDRLEKSPNRSGTWEASLLMRKGDELDLIAKEDRGDIEEELLTRSEDLARLERLKAQAEAAKALVEFGATEAGAAAQVGWTEEQVRQLLSTPNPDNAPGLEAKQEAADALAEAQTAPPEQDIPPAEQAAA